ncbi:MAG TPA: right-handed parallel beta-helix repeat-containing protein [Candidatus Binatia bacterium]|nr:right-handed parallel beta-helix repeat-containing protein [Candidatus Binatia bacterium]
MGRRVVAAMLVGGLLWAPAAAISFPPPPPLKVEIVPTRFDDPTPPPEACEGVPPDCSLRGAILFAEANPDTVASNIPLPAGTYTLAQGALEVAGTLTLTGAGADTTVIDGQNLGQVIVVDSGATLGVTGVTLQGGHGQTGGAVDNAGTLSLTDCVVRDSTAKYAGGGIYNGGALTLVRSTIAGNQCFAGTGAGLLSSVASTLTLLEGCTISDNGASTTGGGIVGDGAVAITLRNCTVSGNQSGLAPLLLPGEGGGGGIALLNGADATLNNVTITNNGAGGDGGGVFVDNQSTLQLGNTILAGNQAPPGLSLDCSGSPTSVGYTLLANLPRNGSCLVHGSIMATDDARLGPLADNGGPTKTHALLPGSPAIDAGNPAPPGSGGTACEATDQRGVPRGEPGDGRCDIGAYEAVTTSTTTTTTSTTLPAGGCDPAALPLASLAGVDCALAGVEHALAGPPQPDCARHCRCALRTAPIAAALAAATQATSKKRCKGKVGAMHRAAKGLGRKVAALVRRRCLTPTSLAQAVARQTADLADRAAAFARSSYCTQK